MLRVTDEIFEDDDEFFDNWVYEVNAYNVVFAGFNNACFMEKQLDFVVKTWYYDCNNEKRG